MITLKSLYKENSASVDRFNKLRYYPNRQLKHATRYGNERTAPLEPERVIVWLGNECVTDDGSILSDAILDALSPLVSAGAAKLFAQDESLMDKLAERFPEETLNDIVQAHAQLAHAGCVISFGHLPLLFLKREGQRHIHVPVEGELLCSRIERASFGISSLLSADWIVAHTADEMDRLVELYQLEGAYEGRLIAADEAGENLGLLLNSLVCGSYDGNSYRKLPKLKKSLLLFCDNDQSSNTLAYLLHVLSLIDYSRYDVTIITQSFSNTNVDDLFDLDDRIRIVLRVGSFSCTQQDYVAIQVINECLYRYEVLDLIDLLPMQALVDEIERLLPTMRFDGYFYCGKIRKLWQLLSIAIPAKKKTMLQHIYANCVLPGNVSDERRMSFNCQAALVNRVYDSVVFANDEMREGLEPLLPDCACGAWTSMLPLYHDAGRKGSAEAEVVIGETSYFVYSTRAKGVYRRSLIFEKLPDTKRRYACFSTAESLLQSISRCVAAFDEESVVIIFVENKGLESSSNVLPSLPEYVKLVDCDSFEGSYDFGACMQQFDAYLLLDGGDESSLRYLVESVGISLFEVSDQGEMLAVTPDSGHHGRTRDEALDVLFA